MSSPDTPITGENIAEIVRQAVRDEVASLRSEFVTKSELKEIQDLVERINKDGGTTQQRVNDLERSVSSNQVVISDLSRSVKAITENVSKIENAASSIQTAVEHITKAAETRQKRIDEINSQVEKNEDKISANSREVDDLRQRFTETFNPVHDLIMGSKSHKPLMVVIEEMKKMMQDDLTSLKKDVQPTIEWATIQQKRWHDISTFLTSRLGAVVVSIVTLAVLGLFGNVDLNMFGSGIVKLLFGG